MEKNKQSIIPVTLYDDNTKCQRITSTRISGLSLNLPSKSTKYTFEGLFAMASKGADGMSIDIQHIIRFGHFSL